MALSKTMSRRRSRSASRTDVQGASYGGAQEGVEVRRGQMTQRSPYSTGSFREKECGRASNTASSFN
eukprot:scaffold1954_cov268-Pinguiococcus_pyrenoidosus.AAC.303